MNEKGNTWVWVGLIFFVAIIVLITILIITNQNPSKKQNEIHGINNMDVYLMAKDSKYQTYIDGKYILLNGTSYIQGNLVRDAFTEIRNISNNYTEILCQAEGFYSNKIYHKFTAQEQLLNSSKINCYLNKVGNIQVDSKDKLENGNIKVNLIILAKGYYQNLKFCTSWTSGVINVQTNYNETQIPERYDNLVDRCYNLNLTLKDESITIPLTIKSEGLNKLDSVQFIFFDEDYFFDGTINNTYSAIDNINLGSPTDTIYTLDYQGN